MTDGVEDGVADPEVQAAERAMPAKPTFCTETDDVFHEERPLEPIAERSG